MNIEFETSWIISVLLVSIRLAVLMFATPLDGMGRVPTKVRIYFTLGMSALLVNVVGVEVIEMPNGLTQLIIMAMNEFIVGLALAFGIYAAFAAFHVGGRLLDFQTGFGAANVLNPVDNTQSPVIGTLLVMLAALVFFLLDLHHLWLRGIAYSLEVVPIGTRFHGLNIDLIVAQFGKVFVYGLVVAAPVVIGLLLVDVGVAVMARTMPQMNVYFLFLPLKIFLGLTLLALSLRYMLPLIETILKNIFVYWHLLLS